MKDINKANASVMDSKELEKMGLSLEDLKAVVTMFPLTGLL